MMDNAVAKRYAQALFALAQERQEIKKVEGELLALKEAFEANESLRKVLYHQLISSTEKKNMIKELSTKFSQTTANFLFILIDKRREKYLETIIDLYHHMCLELEKVVTAEVITAAPLSEQNRQELVNKLTELTGKKVIIDEAVDEKILGGLVVKIADKILDGSVAARLNSLRSALNKVQI